MPSIQSKFPKDTWNIIDTQLYIGASKQNCYNDAMYFFWILSTWETIATKMDIHKMNTSFQSRVVKVFLSNIAKKEDAAVFVASSVSVEQII